MEDVKAWTTLCRALHVRIAMCAIHSLANAFRHAPAIHVQNRNIASSLSRAYSQVRQPSEIVSLLKTVDIV